MAEGDRRADPAYAATVAAFDEIVGRLMTTLKDLGLDRNTLVVFTSDNGGTPQYVGPLNGSKGSLYEGGLRVPCAVWWSGIASPGRTFGQPVLSMDFYPTLAELAGAALPTSQPIDGVSLAPVLNGENSLASRGRLLALPLLRRSRQTLQRCPLRRLEAHRKLRGWQLRNC